MTVREVDNPVNNARSIHKTTRLGGPALWQPIFDRNATEKYQELCNFEIEVRTFL